MNKKNSKTDKSKTVKKKVVKKPVKKPIEIYNESKLITFKFNDVEYKMEHKQRLFCMCYVRNGFNQTQAAIEAGYSEKTAKSQASRLLTNVNLQAYVEALKEDLSAAIGVSAIDIANEYKKVGFLDIRKLFNTDGTLKKVHELDNDTAAALASLDVLEFFAGVGEDRAHVGNISKIRMHNKLDALDKLARMLGKDGVTKVAATDAKGKTVTPPPATNNFITLDPTQLPTQLLEAIIQHYEKASAGS